jgi:hypothetical protein
VRWIIYISEVIRDDAGSIMAWKETDSYFERASEPLSLQNVSLMHIEAFEDRKRVGDFLLFIQLKSGSIEIFRFKGDFEKIDQICVGNFTFCKASVIPAGNGFLIAYPDVRKEDTVSVVEWPAGRMLIDRFAVTESGMCLFTKLCFIAGQLHLLTGYESGSLSLVRCEDGNAASIFSARVLKEGLICAAFDPANGSIVIAGAGSEVKVFRNFLRENQEEDAFNVPMAGFNSAAIRPDGRLLVLAGWDAK